MKELSIEEKAKAYDEALERAEKALEVLGTDKCEGARQILSLFPELAESEDEKIRKELIDIVKKSPITFAFEDKGKVLAWLEKQGVQKPQRMISAGAKEAMYNKPAWSEEDQNALEDVREAVVHYWGGDTQDILLYWLKSIKQKLKGE